MEEQFNQLCKFATEKMDATHIPGAAIGILHNRVTYSAGFGVTSIAHPLAVTDETLFQIGSITKTFTALLLLQLVDQDKLDLDTPVQQYLPNFSVQDDEASGNVTVRHLLTHTAGWIGDHFLDTGLGDAAITRYVQSMAELPQLVPLGYSPSYNNAGFGLCESIIETITGKSYPTAVREGILEPLSMTNAYFDAADVITQRYAVGHLVTEDVSVAEPWQLPRSLYAAGGLCCSALDLLKYAWYQMGDGRNADDRRLLSQELMAQLHGQHVSIDGAYKGIGLSWFLGSVPDNDKPLAYVTHTGGTNGQITQLLIIPEAEFAIAFFTNANTGREIIGPVTAEAIRLFLGAEWPHPTPTDVDAELVSDCCGTYTRPHATLELRLEEKQLDVAQLMLYITPQGGFPKQDSPIPSPPPPAPCAFFAPDRLIVLDGPSKHSQLEIVRLQNGEIGWLRFGMRLHRRHS